MHTDEIIDLEKWILGRMSKKMNGLFSGATEGHLLTYVCKCRLRIQ